MLVFSKYHGLGNDFILMDCRDAGSPPATDWIHRLTEKMRRRHGIGADGVLLLQEHPSDGNLSMTVINSDGTQPEMCGNGLRCFVHYAVRELGVSDSPLFVHTGSGLLRTEWDERENGDFWVTVSMGAPIFELAKVPTLLPTNPGPLLVNSETVELHSVSMGNPHALLFSPTPPELSWMQSVADAVETSGLYPEGVNLGFVSLVDGEVLLRVHERGCGFTEACGTGACAAVAALSRAGHLAQDTPIPVLLPGGRLEITWSSHDNQLSMKGPSQWVFTGRTSLTE